MDKPSCSKYQSNVSSPENRIIEQVMDYLKPLDELLKCHICFEYFNTCLITKCSHNFCSFCIRKYMSYKSQCPQCFQETSEPELRSNRQIDEILFLYNELRDHLESYAVNRSNLSSWGTDLLPKSSLINVSTQCLQNDDDDDDDDDSSIIVPDVSVSKSKLGKEKCVPKTTDIVSENVQCPVCSAFVLPAIINTHLDRCLTMAENAGSKEKDRRKSLPKLVYHLLSEKDIKKRLKEHGLSTSGSKQSLIKRHKNFVLLYNSECDKLNPKPVPEIVKQVEKEEKDLKQAEPVKLFQSNKKSNPVVIEEENEEYLRENEHQFKALVSEIAMRQLQKKSSLTKHKGHLDVSICSNKVSSEEDSRSKDVSVLSNSDLFDDSTVSVEDSPTEKLKMQQSQHTSSDSDDDDVVLISSQ